MGFGILFVGYFLILNFAYPAFTDVIAAAIMLYALYKSSGVNRGFKVGAWVCFAFTVFGFAEFIIEGADMFFAIGTPEVLSTVMAAARHLIILLLTVTAMAGIRDVAGEVELYELQTKAKSSITAATAVYALSILLEAAFPSFIPVQVLAYISMITLIATLMLIIFNLTIIYSAYMHICMPEELDDGGVIPESKFGFVNEFRRRQEDKTREYIEYKLEKRKKKAEKKQNKK